jgi:hypothetical protein
MYLDIKGLVTCGVGNLIDTPSEAAKLPWKWDRDGTRASDAEIRTAWHNLKLRQDLARRHVSHARALTGLHLDDADIDALVASKLESNDAFIAKWFPGWADIPADAQLAVLSMAWAVGPAFNQKFPKFTNAALSGNWEAAREHCTIREEGNPGVVPRNRANRLCFSNAALVLKTGGQPHILHWPDVKPVPAVRENDDTRAIALAAADDAAFLRSAAWRSEAKRELSNLGPEPFPLDSDDDEITVLDAGASLRRPGPA